MDRRRPLQVQNGLWFEAGPDGLFLRHLPLTPQTVPGRKSYLGFLSRWEGEESERRGRVSASLVARRKVIAVMLERSRMLDGRLQLERSSTSFLTDGPLHRAMVKIRLQRLQEDIAQILLHIVLRSSHFGAFETSSWCLV